MTELTEESTDLAITTRLNSQQCHVNRSDGYRFPDEVIERQWLPSWLFSVAFSCLLAGREAGGHVVGCPMHSPHGKQLRAACSQQPMRTEALSPLPVRG